MIWLKGNLLFFYYIFPMMSAIKAMSFSSAVNYFVSEYLILDRLTPFFIDLLYLLSSLFKDLLPLSGVSSRGYSTIKGKFNYYLPIFYYNFFGELSSMTSGSKLDGLLFSSYLEVFSSLVGVERPNCLFFSSYFGGFPLFGYKFS